MSQHQSAYDRAKSAADFLLGRFGQKPTVGIVLGSGLGAFADQLPNPTVVHFEEIPHFHKPSVAGHGGRILFSVVKGVPIVVQQGRVHYYEGHSIQEVVHPARTLGLLGVRTVFLTNAAGGLQSDMEPGDLMVIKDHINLMGTNPLIGPNLEKFGTRFPDMTEAYSKRIRDLLKTSFDACSLRHREGVYIGLSGPTYETPSEVRYLQKVGGDAVGMSTVPETIALRHMGVEVGAISCITNKAAGISPHPLSHEEVTEAGRKVEKHFAALLFKVLESPF